MKQCADLGICDVEFFTKALDQHLSPKGTAIISQLFSLLFISLTLSGNEEFHTNEHEFDTMSGFENEFPLGMNFKPKTCICCVMTTFITFLLMSQVKMPFMTIRNYPCKNLTLKNLALKKRNQQECRLMLIPSLFMTTLEVDERRKKCFTWGLER